MKRCILHASLFVSDFLDICDPVLSFDQFMEGINLTKYLNCLPEYETGRIRYNPIHMLKTVLFGFMTQGYMLLRELEDSCKVNLRFMYLMDNEHPTYRTFGYFINEVLANSIEEIFYDINQKIFASEQVDLNHIYIDGSKFEANANKYSWVWKKATEKSRYRLFEKITVLLEEINTTLAFSGIQMQTNTEYVPEELKEMVSRYADFYDLDYATFVYGKGHRKSVQQRQYETLLQYATKLDEYVEKVSICGPDRNSYSKTDHSATFMRIKMDYMGNDQLLPAYNVQVGVADEYIAVLDVNQYGRQEEVYTCEDCSGCPYVKECKKTDKNRTIRLNEELTSFHKEVIENLESIHGALLRMNRSIQAEGTFGIMKNDRWYKRIVRKGIDSVKLEIFLVAIGQNLYKYHNKKMRLSKVA